MEGLTKQPFLIVVVEAAKNPDWDLSLIGKDDFVAYMKIRSRKANEKIFFHVDVGRVILNSTRNYFMMTFLRKYLLLKKPPGLSINSMSDDLHYTVLSVLPGMTVFRKDLPP